MPGDKQPPGGARYRSAGHHTEGLPARESAVVAAQEMATTLHGDLAVEGDFPWDGEGVPAMTLFFHRVGDKLRPI